MAPSPRRGSTPAAPRSNSHKLVVETVNGTTWAGIQKWLGLTSADVVLAQETSLSIDEIAAASEWASRKGWKSLWEPAEITPKLGRSAGVAVFARAWMGLSEPANGAVVAPFRSVAGLVEPPGFLGGIVCYASYYHVGEGLSPCNVEISEAVA